MSKKEFKRIITNMGADVVLEFKNSAKEDFLVYKFPEMPAYLITGDEFDWEAGWMLQKGDFKEALQIFQFSGEEQAELRKFWDEQFKAEQARFESTHKERKTEPVGFFVDTTKVEEVSDGDSSTTSDTEEK